MISYALKNYQTFHPFKLGRMSDSFSSMVNVTLINQYKLVQVTGLEPVRYKTHAPQACLAK